LISVVMSWFNIHSPAKQAPAAAVYQQHMEILSKNQVTATNQQATAVDRLSDTLIDTQKKAAVAERKAVAAAIATNPTKPESP
jgi:ribosomal protein L17